MKTTEQRRHMGQSLWPDNIIRELLSSGWPEGPGGRKTCQIVPDRFASAGANSLVKSGNNLMQGIESEAHAALAGAAA